MGSRESVNPAFNSFLNKKKPNIKNSFTGEQSGNNNTNSDLKGISNYNYESSKQKMSFSKEFKKNN